MISAIIRGIVLGTFLWVLWTMHPTQEMSWQAQCMNNGGHVVSDGRTTLYCVERGEAVSAYVFEE